jgi:choline-sulfatase
MKRVLLAAAVVVAAMFVVATWRGSESGQSGLRTDSEQVEHVLLITIDTLRADRLGSYGWAEARTPVLDGLAQRGVRFTRAYATAPITLTSHATLLTGRYPPGHAARHNGMAMRNDVRTLATAFKSVGFDTAAFVSAFPLDRRFGLDRGFDVYDDELARGDDGRPKNERPGTVTVDRAIAWQRGLPSSGRRFAWIHLFEPHAPYDGPEHQSSSERYDEEIHVADREIGRLLDAWGDRDRTLVVVTADHGEAFGEHGEIGHSIFVYDTTLRVPLILVGPGLPRGTTVDVPITLADLAPTIVRAAKLPDIDADGLDLRPMIDGAAASDRVLYAESFAPLLDFGWAPLRSVRRQGVKLIAAPRPELYELGSDPAEEHNAFDVRGEVARDLIARVDRISPPELPAQAATADREAVARLRALGYTGGASAPGSSRPDPKDRIRIASRMAAVTSGELQGDAAARALTEVLKEDAGNVQAHVRLGYLLAESGQCAAAEPHFSAAIAGGLTSADAHLGLGMCQIQRGAGADALTTFRDGLRIEPANPVVEANIGLLELESGRIQPAITALKTALAGDPHLHHARFALARALAREGDRHGALREATDLLTRLPANAPQRPEVERLINALR